MDRAATAAAVTLTPSTVAAPWGMITRRNVPPGKVNQTSHK
jgi:hypothetical protein